ncbi:MAG: gephyrin-like molybdotransferase Glp [Pseudomonadota bacterium]
MPERAPLLSVADARAMILERVRPMPAETVPLTEAHGRVLAADIVASRPQPPFDASAMDGYAVRVAEAVPGARLAVSGEIPAGHASAEALPPGSAMRLFTGAPLPAGADAVLIQEDARRLCEGGHDVIDVVEAPTEGAYVRPAGGDFAPGDRLEAPCRLGPSQIALAAAMGAAAVSVARRPIVAILPTGDELVAPGETPRADQIFASNNYGLAARVAAAGAVPRLLPIARDTPDSLIAALEAARGSDMLVTLGGASVGDHDLVARVFGSAGMTLGFHRIAMRPGKPLMAGTLGHGTLMMGLPGNPVSALVCGELFLVPAIQRAMGLPGDPPRTRPLPLAAPLGQNGPREHYMRATLLQGDAGPAVAAAENQDSSLLGVLAGADVLIQRAPHAGPLPAGAIVNVIDLV